MIHWSPGGTITKSRIIIMRKIYLILWVSLTLLLHYLAKAQNDDIPIISENTNNSVLKAKKNRNIMNGLTFRMPAFDYPPFFSIKRNSNGNYSYGGKSLQILGMIANHFDFRISYVHVNRSEVEQTGMSTTVFRMLVDNEVDITSFPLENKLSYSEKADLLFPFWVADFILMQPWPEEESRLIIPIRPFSPTAWLCVVGSMLIFLVASSIFLFRILKRDDTAQSLSFLQIALDQLEYILSIITLQGSHGRCSGTNRTSLRILVGSWLLAMVVLVYAYQGVLMSILSVPKFKPTVDTWEQLVQQHKFKLTIERSSLLTQHFMEATSGNFKEIRDSIDENLLFGDILKGINNVLYHNCIYPGVKELIYHFISTDFKSNRKCRMTAVAKPLGYYMSYHIAISKNSPYTELLNQDFMLYYMQSGLVNHMRQKTSRSDNPCRVDVKPTGNMSTFKLKDFAFSFFFFGIGVAFSLAIFLLELVFARANGVMMKSNKKSTKIVVVMPVHSV